MRTRYNELYNHALIVCQVNPYPYFERSQAKTKKNESAKSIGIAAAQMRCLLFEDKSPHEAMVDLMTRQLKHEFRE